MPIAIPLPFPSLPFPSSLLWASAEALHPPYGEAVVAVAHVEDWEADDAGEAREPSAGVPQLHHAGVVD